MCKTFGKIFNEENKNAEIFKLLHYCNINYLIVSGNNHQNVCMDIDGSNLIEIHSEKMAGKFSLTFSLYYKQ